MRILIVGAGLTGCTLAHHLNRRGVDVKLLHNGKNVSSAVAAGIINPVVFRRTTLSWRVNELLPFAFQFYKELERVTQTEFFREIPIRRLFAHEQERTTWEKKQEQPEYLPYLKKIDENDMQFETEQNTFGTAVVQQTAVVHSKLFMQANWDYFQAEGILETHPFESSKLDPESGNYQNENYDFIVFCEGKDGKYNPWFGHLPLTQTKGEVLTLSFEQLKLSESLNRKCFLMPQLDGTFKVGSTYVWDTDDATPTEDGKRQILENLTSITAEKPTVVEHEAGVRPTVTDRRPLLGKHPDFPKLVIANGMGAKGFMLVPLLMQELTEHLLDGKELDKETDISRFKKK